MKRLIVFGMVLGLLASAMPGFAQPGEPVWLRPDDVFTPAVEVLEALPFISVDNTARRLYVSAGEGEPIGYPFPDGLEAIEDIRVRSDATYLINAPDYAFLRPRSEDVWVFDPATGVFSHPQAACGSVRDLPGEGTWVISEFPETGRYHLCFTETGQLSSPIPQVGRNDYCESNWRRPPAASPDGRCVVFTDCRYEPETGFSVFSYDRITDEFRVLGLGTNAPWGTDYVEVIRWADDRHPLIRGFSIPNPPHYTLYLADVEAAGSLQLLVHQVGPYGGGLDDWPHFEDDPPRYEWIPDENNRWAAMVPDEGCALYEFRLDTLALTVYPPAEGVCGPGFSIPGTEGEQLYRRVNYPAGDGPAQDATLLRFNPRTGAVSELFTAPIERLIGVSPAGDYAIVALGGVPLSEFAMQPSDRGYFEWGGVTTLAVFDLNTLRIVHEIDLGPVTAQSKLVPDLYWLDEDHLLYRLDGGEFSIQAGHWRLASLFDGEATDEAVDDLLTYVFSDRRYDSQAVMENGRTRIVLISREMGQVIPITQDLDAERYTITLWWQDDGRFEVKIEDTQYGNHFIVGDWLVRLRSGES